MSKKPLEALTELDKKRIHNYVCSYGCYNEKYFVGVDNYLELWNKNKAKLFHALGDNLIVSIPFSYSKSKYEIEDTIRNKIFYHPFFQSVQYYLQDIFNNELKYTSALHDYNNVIENIYPLSFKIRNKKTGGTLQIQKGMKLIRMINKIYEADPEGLLAIHNKWYHNSITVKELEASRQELINLHSEILNDKVIKGTLSISIHPLDFITMSDNGSNWQSCMTWVDNGCYHQGTVEMMNSNCVLCCYLHNSETPWMFNFDVLSEGENKEEWTWNNKKYRQLVYVNKNLVVTGKPYPYSNDDISKKIIKEVKKLLETNMHWTYTFGPEKYQDMKWINGYKSMERAKEFARAHESKKHNIIIETKAMYNDFVRDSQQTYWCYRNKVAGTKVITASGPAHCLCCSNSLTTFLTDESDDVDYYERYAHVGEVVCQDCLKKVICSSCCRHLRTSDRSIIVYDKEGHELEHLCEKCIRRGRKYKKCHCCNKWYSNRNIRKDGIVLRFEDWDPNNFNSTKKSHFFNFCTTYYNNTENWNSVNEQGIFIPLCPECISTHLKKGNILKVEYQGIFANSYTHFYLANEVRKLTDEEFEQWKQNISTLPDDCKIIVDF